MQRPGVAQRLEPLERRRAARPGSRDDGERAHAGDLRVHSTALWPPNPNEFEMATAVARCGGAAGAVRARSRGRAPPRAPPSRASAARRPSRSASTVATASTAPAAPSRWPIADLVLTTPGCVAGALAERRLERRRLGAVVERRRRAVRVDVVDVRPARGRRRASAAAIAVAAPAPPRHRRGQVVGVARSRRSRGSRRARSRRARRRDSASSSTRTPAPSPMTKPSRRASNGREMPLSRERVHRGERGPREPAV